MIIGAASQRSNQLRNSDFFKIHVRHIPTGQKISFEGFVTQFSDTYTAQWNEEQVYGRMDPLATYQGTKRNITLGFDIPADSKVMATHNMKMIQKLIQFMYPVYDSGDLSTQNVLSAAPLLTLKWTNLISSVNNEGQELVGYINGPISYAPDVSDGGFMRGEVIKHEFDDKGELISTSAIRNYFPKKISMSFNFTVLHTHLLGWAPNPRPPISAAARAALAEGGQKEKKITSYIFGSTEETAERFPNIYTAPPKPLQAVAADGEEVSPLDAAAIEADNTLREAEALSPEDQSRSDDFLRKLQNDYADEQANNSQILDPHGHGGIDRDAAWAEHTRDE